MDRLLFLFLPARWRSTFCRFCTVYPSQYVKVSLFPLIFYSKCSQSTIYEFPSRRSMGYVRSLLFQTYAECGDCGEAFIIRCMGPLAANGQTRGRAKMFPLSECTANRRWDTLSKTLFEMLCRPRSECARGFDTPSQFPLALPSLSPQPCAARAHPRPSPRRLRKMCSLPFLSSRRVGRSIQQTT